VKASVVKPSNKTEVWQIVFMASVGWTDDS